MKNWFFQNPNTAKNIIDGLNEKYGNFDFKKSSRVLYNKKFKTFFAKFNCSRKKIALIGGNDGQEKRFFWGTPEEVYVVDLAKDALKKIKGKNCLPIFASAENLPFIDDYIDLYIALRVLFSKHLDLQTALEEAKRVLKPNGRLVASIPNGYLVKGEIVQGMFDYRTNEVNPALPHAYLKKCLTKLKNLGFKNISFTFFPAEIVVEAQKANRPKEKK